MKIVLYARASLDRYGEGRSVDSQITELHRWAEREGHEVVSVHRDDGRSASRYARKTRPGWQDVLDLINGGGVEALAVWEASRASRDRTVWAALIAALTERGAMFVVGGKVHDPTDPDDGFMLDLVGSLAVRESGVISKRTRRGKRSAAEIGRPAGRANFGMRTEYDPVTGRRLRRVLVPEQVEIVRKIAESLLAGTSPWTVAKRLNDRGVPSPTGRAWTGQNLTGLILAPAYAGLREHHEQLYAGDENWLPPILTVDEHERLKARLAPRGPMIRTGEHIKYLLTGVARCAVCDGRIKALTRRRKTGVKIAYICAERFCVSRAAAEIDEYVTGVVLAVLERENLAAELAEVDPATAAAERERDTLRARLDAAYAAAAAGTMTFEAVGVIEKALAPKIAEAEKLIRPRVIPTVVTDAAGPGARERWAALPVPVRREIVRAIAEVKIGKQGRRNQYEEIDYSTISITSRACQPAAA